MDRPLVAQAMDLFEAEHRPRRRRRPGFGGGATLIGILTLCVVTLSVAAAMELEADDLVFEDRHHHTPLAVDSGDFRTQRHQQEPSRPPSDPPPDKLSRRRRDESVREDVPEDSGVLAFISKQLHRVRRQSFLSLFGLGGGADSTTASPTEAATTMTEAGEEPNEMTFFDLRVKRSTLADEGDDDELSNTIEDAVGSTAGLASQSTGAEGVSPSLESSTPGRRTDTPVDDEDYGPSGADGEGSAEPGRSSTARPNATSPGRPRFFRVTMVIVEPWQEKYADRKSDEFQQLSQALADDIGRLFEDVPGKQMANVISIQRAEDHFDSKVVLDLASDNYDKDLLQKTLYSQLERFQKIGNYPAKTDGFLFRDFGAIAASAECEASELACRSGECLPVKTRCDGYADCEDGSDELGCAKRPGPSTAALVGKERSRGAQGEYPWDRCRADDKVRCADGSIYICADQKCDGKSDCPQGDDEVGCPKTNANECAQDEFMCDITRCIPKTLVCDGRRDCVDDTDELNCPDPEQEQVCEADEYQCRDGRCIHGYLRCDRTIDCQHGDDEENCQCGPSEFTCERGGCIESHKRCNGQRECPRDDSDEQNCPSGSTQCNSNEKRCIDGTCIPSRKWCDKHSDCPDKSDEKSCSCSPNDFQCKNGACIPKDQLCDGLVHCSDRSDEESCPKLGCLEKEFQCRSDRSCILLQHRCDRKRDCADGSDEEDCENTCRSDQFRCYNGRCLNLAQRCNGVSECSEGEDERNCPKLPHSQCAYNEFTCRNGQCVDQSKQCDGYADCYDQSDEECDDIAPCPASDFTCLDKSCVSLYKKCDGVYDCADGDDEKNCPHTDGPGTGVTESPQCQPGQFRCQDGQCIQEQYHCDSIKDCLDGSDENSCATCSPIQFTCANGQCLENQRHCDGAHDCADGSDEDGCEICGLGERQCGDGLCVDVSLFCDGFEDCTDGSDETACGQSSCGANEFTCGDRSCIDIGRRCDRRPDCSDRSDEIGCDCRSTEFSCGSGECIPDVYRCDGSAQCPDRSDEDGCSREPPSTPAPPRCSYGQFACASNGQCILRSSVCDGRSDCSDSSDEANCPWRPCLRDEFRCENGPCIPEHLRCDGKVDCHHDNSDELDCTGRPASPVGLNLKTYPPDQIIKESREVVFQCRDEGPIRARVKWSRANNLPLPHGSRDLNGRLEMPNIQLSDSGNYICEAVGYPENIPGSRLTVTLTVEQYTPPTTQPPIACGHHEATCSSGECVAKSKVCDGNLDCSDGSDEMRCNPEGCEPNEFQCDNKKCVMKTWRCDSDDDCGDGSDEKNCATNPPGSRCLYREFECRSGNQCIPKSFHCDGEVDCQDGSDESHCLPVQILEGPNRMEVLTVGDTMTLTCKALGLPTPVIVWRLNWGHVPAKCSSTNENGKGTLICPNVQESDQGAYSCEALNMRGREFAVPDTILVVTSPNKTVCTPGSFNNDARHPGECISCFCFGVATRCKSADLFTYQLPPPLESVDLAGVRVVPYGKTIEVLSGPTYNLPSVRTLGRNGFQIYSTTIERDGFQLGDNVHPYFAMPETFFGNQLKAYGGFLKYNIRYEGNGRPLDTPDVILSGNGYILVHNGNSTSPGQEAERSVRFFYGEWYRRSSSPRDSTSDSDVLASREEIMMALAEVNNLLIKTRYVDGSLDTTLTNIRMDSAGVQNTGQGKASYVEECQCPAGYSGLSCEVCSADYHRREHGPWLGMCMPEERPCPAGTFKNTSGSGQCERCPCPHTNPSNQFAHTCHLDTDGQVTCDCPQGYEGRRCEKCASGYQGNPFIPGDVCRPGFCNPAGSLSTPLDPSSGSCVCKANVTGPYCDQCKANTFHLDRRNIFGCVDCFCMGVSQHCSSSNWYRQQVVAQFTRDAQDFKIVEALKRDEPISSGIHLNPQSRELLYQDFSRRTADVHYWKLPPRFLGNKITSYGGNLKYVIRYVPTPGGQSSRNSAADVELVSSNAAIRLLYFGREQLEANRPQSVTVPLFEQDWQRPDGQKVDRAHMLMALATLEDVLIKATYTTSTMEAALLSVSLDVAEERNTGQERALPVEQCVCPLGHQGLSCEECSTGFARSESNPGLYLGSCVPCNCNGHSTECDPETGVCRDCRGYTTGEQCEQCQPGFEGDATRGDCHPRDDSRCYCDSKGSISSQCNADGSCICKTNVEGRNCDYCRPGTFDLSSKNSEGCLNCFCMGVTDQCQSASLHRTQIPMQILDDNHGFRLTDNNRSPIVESGFNVDWGNNEIGFEFVSPPTETYFWSLPPSFTGNKISSYGGNLTYTQRYLARSGAGITHDTDVVLFGNGVSIYWSNRSKTEPNTTTVVSIALDESAGWFRLDTNGHRSASRRDLMIVLSSLEAILIRSSHSNMAYATFLSDVAMDTAVSIDTGEGYTTQIESCRCPTGYNGLSCESCAAGYYRNTSDLAASVLGSCLPCPCHGNEESCSISSDTRVTCYCKPGYTGRNCDNVGPPGPPDWWEPCHDDEFRCENGPCIPLHQRCNGFQDCQFDGSDELDCNLPSPSPPQLAQPPTIRIEITEPTILISEVGSTVRFTCTARPITNRGPVRIQWSKQGGNLPRDRSTDDGSGRLVIISAHVSDSGTYICTATDGSSYVTETATVTIGGSAPSAPVVHITPRYLDIQEGEAVEFTCHATGIPQPSLQWTGGPNNPLASFVNGVFRIPVAQRSDEAEYFCIAINPLGNVTERTILYVKESSSRPRPPDGYPKLTVSPPEFNGPAGETVRLICGASGLNEYYTLQWSKVGSPDLPSTATQQDGVLTIHNANPADSGIYLCRATSRSTGAIEDVQTRVTVSSTRGPPTARIEPERQTVSQGTTAELRCLTSADPSSVRWTKVGEPDMGSNVQTVGNVLKINSALTRNRGVYVCSVQNEGGSSQASTILEIERREPPAIEIYPDGPQTATVGGSTLLQCRVISGIPAPAVIWRRTDGRPLSPNIQEHPNGLLRFDRVTTADAGAYTCEAQNEVGITDATASLEIESVPTITILPSSQITVHAGQPVRLECRAHGDPHPSVIWSRNRPGYAYYEPTNLTAETPQNAVYEITRASKADQGSYSCTARNKAGLAEDRVQLIVEESNEVLDRYPERGDITGEDPGSYGDLAPFVVNVGGSAELRCASNRSNTFIKWSRQDGEMPVGHSVYKESLMLSNVQEEDAGVYMCEGYENGQILFSAPARLVVNGPPRLQLHPPHQVVRPGESARVQCRVLSSGPHSIEWTIRDRPGPLPPNAVDRNGILEFTRIGPQDSGYYLCRVRNAYGEVDATAEVLVQDPPPASIVTAVDHEIVVREGSTAHLHCRNEAGTQITWTHEGRALPDNAVQQGGTLTIQQVRASDAGRYECQAMSDADVGSDYVNLHVEVPQEYCPSENKQCYVRRVLRCVPQDRLCNGYNDCDDGSDEDGCPTNRSPRGIALDGNEGATKFEIDIKASQNLIRNGDNVEVRCSVSGDPGASVSWTKVGSQLANNVHVIGDVIRITEVQHSNVGIYRCNAATSNGQLSEDYTLSLETPPVNLMEPPPVEKRTAAYGMTVVMDCKTDLTPPIKYLWSKQEGELPRDAKGATESSLTIMDVRAQDAGFYTCTAQNDEVKMDIRTVLVVTGVVPYFAQAPNSFMALPTLLEAYLYFNISISFKPERSDGLILYNGQQSGGSGDFVSLGLNNGFVEFRFDVGSGPAVIKSSIPVSLGQWHTVKLIRSRKDGEMYVDGYGPYRGTAAGRFQGLDLVEPLYLGGVPNFRNIHRLTGHSQGFVGCISRLVIGNVEHELVRDATATEGVTTCETCAGSTCQHNGVCQEAPTATGYTCICPAGFSGDDCSKAGQSCYPGACGIGRCVNLPFEGMQCLCPLGKAGRHCEYDVVIHDPAFSNGAYLAYPVPKTPRKLKMTLRLNPSDLSDSLVMYTAQNEDGTGDFAALSIKDRHIEFRFDAGTGTSVLKSNRDLQRGEWYTISISRDLKEARLAVNGEPVVTQRIHSSSKPLDLQTPLYIGGYDTQKIHLAPGMDVDQGFSGCVSEVDVASLSLQLIGSVVDSVNVEDCSTKHGLRSGRGELSNPCHFAPCQNGGICDSKGSHHYTCTCIEGFSGKDCEIEPDMCTVLHPCTNGGTCSGSISSYKCQCPIGFGGSDCSSKVQFSSQVSLSGDGWLELNRDLLPHKPTTEDEVISIRFTTNDTNSLILWQGQAPDDNGQHQDYLSLSIVNGKLEWSYELGSGPAHIRLDSVSVNDGHPHTVVLRRKSEEGSIELDGQHKAQGHSNGSLSQLNTNGNIYIGGVPNVNLITGNTHSHGFSGCIHAVQIQNSKVLNLYEESISGGNVVNCPKSDDE